MSETFKLMGQGFDTIQFSLVVRIPEALSETIRAAQRLAKENRQPEPVELGPGQVPAEILSHGGGGGDAIISTGELGEMYFLKLDQKKDQWGATIKIRALTLLCYGLPGALDRMWKRVQGMGLKSTGYSLGRVDYRFDVLTDPDFFLREDCLIRHNRALVRPFESVDRFHPLWIWNEDPESRRVLRGQRIETLMVGKIGTSIQVVIYDKRSELTLARKYSLLESYGLTIEDKTWQLYRVEVRYAGDALKRRWNVRDLPALRRNLHMMLSKALHNVRYVRAPNEATSSRSSLHPFWKTVVEAVPNATCEQPSLFAPERAEWSLREERRRSLKSSIAGCAIGLAVMQSNDEKEMIELAPVLASDAVKRALIIDPTKAAQAAKRHRQQV